MISVDKNLKVGGTTIKSPTTISVQRNKLWSSKSGRTKSGNYVGDLTAIKYRIDLTWTAVSEADAKELSNTFAPAFISVQFKDPHTNKLQTKQFYGGDITYGVYNYAVEKAVYQSISISIVEK